MAKRRWMACRECGKPHKETPKVPYCLDCRTPLIEVIQQRAREARLMRNDGLEGSYHSGFRKLSKVEFCPVCRCRVPMPCVACQARIYMEERKVELCRESS